MTALKERSLWSTAKQIFKPKSSRPLQTSSEEEDEPRTIEFTKEISSPSKSPNPMVNPSTNSNVSKIALPSYGRSKATVATASTTLSTVNSTTYSSSSPLGSTPGHHKQNDEFSYSCAASTQWTSTPSPKTNTNAHAGSTSRGVPDLPLVEKSAASMSINTSMHSLHRSTHSEGANKAEEKEEEMDGFVELITERHRSRRYSSITDPVLTSDTISASRSKSLNSIKIDEAPKQVASQDYCAQGYNLMKFYQNDNFLSQSDGLAQEKEEAVRKSSAKSRQEGSASKNDAMASATAAVEIEQSESPDEPPSTQRKSVNPEFFMDDAVAPPSPTNGRRSREKQMQQQQQQQQVSNNDDYDNPNHFYAEINVKHRPQPITRTGSEGIASLAMTSISSITGHESLFAKDYDAGGLSPLLCGLWQTSSTVVKTVEVDENYFDYSKDETAQECREEDSGLLEQLGNVINNTFCNACQCLDTNNSLSISPDAIKKENTSVVDAKALHETGLNGKNKAVGKLTTRGRKSKEKNGGESMFLSQIKN